MSTAPRPRGIYGVAKKDVPGVIMRAQAMANGVQTHAALFGSPTITMVVFLALIAALVTAQQDVAGTKAKGAATLRNAKRDAVWTAMEILRAYMQGLADSLAAESAASLLEAGGLLVAALPVHQKAPLQARLTTTLGLVHLDANVSFLVGPANASKKVLLNWQMSADGGKTWTDLRSTTYASTDVPGLALMSTYSFRVSVTVGREIGAWSQAVSVFVH